MRSKAFLGVLFVGLASWCMSLGNLIHGTSISGEDVWAASSTDTAAGDAASPSLKAGEKIKIDDAHYFVYSFDKKPQMGTTVLKIQVFDKDGKLDTPYEITGNSGMPSMRGAHDTGEQAFKQNKKGEYLLPVNVVMPGDWEVRLQFLKDKKPIFLGWIQFDV